MRKVNANPEWPVLHKSMRKKVSLPWFPEKLKIVLNQILRKNLAPICGANSVLKGLLYNFKRTILVVEFWWAMLEL